MLDDRDVKRISDLLLSVANQAMARGLFSNVEDIPMLIEAVKYPRQLFSDMVTMQQDHNDQLAALQSENQALKEKIAELCPVTTEA